MLHEDKARTILQKVRTIELRTRALMNDALSGAYHSIFKGQGINFEEVREYTPGDEVRFIDWNISAKLGKPFVKVFREERELTLLLAIDISGSTQCGSIEQSKREFATEIASIFAFSALKNNDKVGLFLFSDKVEKFIPPLKGRKQLLRLIRESLFFQPEHKQTNLCEALTALGQLQKKKAIVCLISDFIPMFKSDFSEELSALSRLNQHHDLFCIQIKDPREQTLPNVGYIALEDAEIGQTFFLNTRNKKLCEQFENQQKDQQKNIQLSCQRKGIDFLQLTNGQNYLSALQTFFKRRQQVK